MGLLCLFLGFLRALGAHHPQARPGGKLGSGHYPERVFIPLLRNPRVYIGDPRFVYPFLVLDAAVFL